MHSYIMNDSTSKCEEKESCYFMGKTRRKSSSRRLLTLSSALLLMMCNFAVAELKAITGRVPFLKSAAAVTTINTAAAFISTPTSTIATHKQQQQKQKLRLRQQPLIISTQERQRRQLPLYYGHGSDHHDAGIVPPPTTGTSDEEDINTIHNNKNMMKESLSSVPSSSSSSTSFLEDYQNNKLDIQLLLIDNYDSYTYNLYSYLCTICKYEPIVISNDAYDNYDDLINDLSSNTNLASPNGATNKKMKGVIDGIIISPGPGRPERAEDMGVCLEAIEKNPDIPILGVCLGHQALGHYYNASVALAPCGPVHGLMSKVHYNDNDADKLMPREKDIESSIPISTTEKIPRCDLFHDIPQLFDVVRYHSLVVEFPQNNNANVNVNVNNKDSLKNNNDDSNDIQNRADLLDIEPIAWCQGTIDNEIFTDDTDSTEQICMALQHKRNPHYGVQFHPESVGTGETGYKILKNFCNHCVDWWQHCDTDSHNQKRSNGNTKKTNVGDEKNIASKINGNIEKNGVDYNGDANVNGNIDTIQNNGEGRTSTNRHDSVSSDSELSTKYEVLIHKIDASFVSNLPLPETVFEELYANEDASFWLDSSTGRKDADLEDRMKGLKNGSKDIPQQCPIVSNSRFSIMGSNDGPLSKKIEYWGNDHPGTKQGVFISQTENDIMNQIKVDSDLISYLHDEISSNGVVQNIRTIDSIYEIDIDGQHVDNFVETSADIPFDYRGGYVGYLGYEVRHDTRRAICKQEICNLDKSEINDNEEKIEYSNPNVPTAAFLFADRSLLYDHWRGDWYVIGVAEKQKTAVNTNLEGTVASVTQWMREITQKLKTMEGTETQLNDDNTINFSLGKESLLDFSLVRSKEQYTKDIARCHDEIKNGESYELCVTNQFQTTVSFPQKSLAGSPFGLYKILRKKNPAPFAAFLNFNSEEDNGSSASICCSSPERFLSISKPNNIKDDTDSSLSESHGWEFAPPFVSSNSNDSNYVIESKPIKGTSKRTINDDDGIAIEIKLKEDAEVAEELRTSAKNRAENLMIVDLLRNDLSRVCEPGSVHVPKLMAIESFATVHQMVSTIRGLIKPDETPIDVISACFPGGSMTGAPKLRSIDILNEMELGKSRGPYSGCLGYISLNGCMDMNIVIRTAVLTPGSDNSTDGKESSKWDIAIGAGGAITALSESEDEFEEMVLKSRAVKESVQQWFDENSS